MTRGKHWFEPGDLAALLGSGMRSLRRVQMDLKVQLVQAGVAGTLEEHMRERLLQVRCGAAALRCVCDCGAVAALYRCVHAQMACGAGAWCVLAQPSLGEL
jgi:hypothetical protein